jgi:hypothetical protein
MAITFVMAFFEDMGGFIILKQFFIRIMKTVELMRVIYVD